jgi:hypothetical protein
VPWDPREDAWFAGFADGEGYFQLRRQNNRGWRIEPRFRIHLRSDDAEVLHHLRAAFGGSVRDGKNGVWSPQAHWLVSSKADLRGLVEYFHRFPLRAKKARDCEVWCEAVEVYCAASGVHPDLFVLHDKLVAGRAFALPAAG